MFFSDLHLLRVELSRIIFSKFWTFASVFIFCSLHFLVGNFCRKWAFCPLVAAASQKKEKNDIARGNGHGMVLSQVGFSDLRPPQVEDMNKFNFYLVWSWPCGARQHGAKIESPFAAARPRGGGAPFTGRYVFGYSGRLDCWNLLARGCKPVLKFFEHLLP